MALPDSVLAFGKLWAALKSERLGELPLLDQWAGRVNSHDYFTTLIKSWQEIHRALGNLPKKKRSSLVDCENAIVTSLGAANFLLTNRGNGTQWLLDKGILPYLAASEGQFLLLRQRISEERLAISTGYQLAVEANAKLILDAESNVSSIIATDAKTSETLASAIESQEEIKKIQESANKRLQRVGPILDEAEKRAGDFEASLKSVSDSEESARLASESLSELATAAGDQHTTSKEWLRQAEENLGDALRSVKQQGLAGAFAEKAVAVNAQLAGEKATFRHTIYYLALVGLLALALAFYQGYPDTLEAWAVRIIQMGALAAPGVWIGWITARRMAALSQILSDYEYKAATALAFEGYKKEVQSVDDPVLMETLLAQAIRAFGENPTHYYDRTKNDPHHPAEGVIDEIKRRLRGRQETKASAAPVVDEMPRKIVATPGAQ